MKFGDSDEVADTFDVPDALSRKQRAEPRFLALSLGRPWQVLAPPVSIVELDGICLFIVIVPI